MKPSVFLTGSSGRIGKRVLNKLLTRGYRIRALIHKNKPEEVVDGEVEFVQGDIQVDAFEVVHSYAPKDDLIFGCSHFSLGFNSCQLELTHEMILYYGLKIEQ